MTSELILSSLGIHRFQSEQIFWDLDKPRACEEKQTQSFKTNEVESTLHNVNSMNLYFFFFFLTKDMSGQYTDLLVSELQSRSVETFLSCASSQNMPVPHTIRNIKQALYLCCIPCSSTLGLGETMLGKCRLQLKWDKLVCTEHRTLEEGGNLTTASFLN